MKQEIKSAFSWGWFALLSIVFLGTVGSALYSTRIKAFEPRNGSLVVMTYNIQQANDDFGERFIKSSWPLSSKLSRTSLLYRNQTRAGFP